MKAWRDGERGRSIGWDAAKRGTWRKSGFGASGQYEDIGGVQRGCRMEASNLVSNCDHAYDRLHVHVA